jgi:hypothetical protein
MGIKSIFLAFNLSTKFRQENYAISQHAKMMDLVLHFHPPCESFMRHLLGRDCILSEACDETPCGMLRRGFYVIIRHS